MKSLIKSLMLALAAIIAVGGIMIFAKTRVSPPKVPKEVDQYALDVEKDVETITANRGTIGMDSIFDDVIVRIDIYNKEDKINPEESDKLTSKLVNTYSEAVIATCKDIFTRVEWPEKDLNWIKGRMKIIGNVHLSSGASPLDAAKSTELTKYSQVITDYGNARDIAQLSKFNGWQAAADAIDGANKYLNDEYLKNNRELVSGLKGVAQRLHSSCYENVVNQVSMLADFEHMSKEDFYSMRDKAQSAVNDYKENSPKVFGGANDVSALQADINTYSEQAEEHYKPSFWDFGNIFW